MEQAVRTFIAVKISPGKKLVEALTHLQHELSEEDAVKWVNPENIHVTLKFLGNTSPGEVKKVERILESVVAKYKLFQGSLKGLGYFKTKRQPRVLFAEIFDVDQLGILANEIDTEIEKLGFEKESRNFKPHLTLARIKFLKNKIGFYRLVDQYKFTEFQSVPVNEIIFYQSKLKPGGPVYYPIKKFGLKS